MPTTFDHPCLSVRARQKNDHRRGFTTSQASIDFIRRTCSCQSCKDWRTGSTVQTNKEEIAS